MPYATNEDLPAAVRKHLPPGAQRFFRATFNSAFQRYGESRAFRIAWAAVKRRYERADGTWVPRRRAHRLRADAGSSRRRTARTAATRA
jgi:cation transport regulator